MDYVMQNWTRREAQMEPRWLSHWRLGLKITWILPLGRHEETRTPTGLIKSQVP